MDMRSIKREAARRDREMLDLYERSDSMSYEELGRRLGLSASTVGFRVRRARGARAWQGRETARKLEVFRNRLSRIDGERRSPRGR